MREQSTWKPLSFVLIHEWYSGAFHPRATHNSLSAETESKFTINAVSISICILLWVGGKGVLIDNPHAHVDIIGYLSSIITLKCTYRARCLGVMLIVPTSSVHELPRSAFNTLGPTSVWSVTALPAAEDESPSPFPINAPCIGPLLIFSYIGTFAHGTTLPSA